MATIKFNTIGEKYCSECRMLQRHNLPYCSFCGAFFSNYEEVVIQSLKDEEDGNIANYDS